jgi:transglutaminase-like putative cysteine protease
MFGARLTVSRKLMAQNYQVTAAGSHKCPPDVVSRKKIASEHRASGPLSPHGVPSSVHFVSSSGILIAVAAGRSSNWPFVPPSATRALHERLSQQNTGVQDVKQAAKKGAGRQIAILRSAALLLAIVLCACQGQPGDTSTPPVSGEVPSSLAVLRTADYEVRETLTVVNRGPGQPSKQNIWLALIRDLPPYQTVRSMEISPEGYQLIVDEYGNRYAEFDLSDMPPGATIQIQLAYTVSVNEPAYDLADCTGDMPDEFTQAELHVESNNVQIVELSQEVVEGKSTVCEQVRSIYDYIGNHLVYSFNGADWGAQAALGEMGADCTEYASLMMALTRAAGIPARYLEGLWAGGDLGSQGARTEHAWLEVYLPGVGWTPMDPTLGRSSLSRDEYFAHLPPDHIVVTVGRNPSTLRGASYWTHLYWPGKSTEIRIEGFEWVVSPVAE